MNIAIIDADLIYNKKHRFPNLACMKISGYYKEHGYHVELKLDYNELDVYDKVFISKVFTETQVSSDVLNLPNVYYGGTGFFYDEAPSLPYEIEHHMPDYHLYDQWIHIQLQNGGKRSDYKYYLDYSIGFLTRGCFRKCSFCVNKNYNKVELHSPLDEFYDKDRKKICLLDDNFLGYSDWKKLLLQLQNTKKKFQFKQGLDERILTPEKCDLLFNSKYDGDFIFAFDDIKDSEIIEQKALLIRKYYDKNNIKFYVLCGFDKNNIYDSIFWEQDIINTFKRIFILAKYNFIPYIMRYYKYKESPLYGTYVTMARWCNQPSLFKKFSFKEFCQRDDLLKNCKKGHSATWEYYIQLINTNKEFINLTEINPINISNERGEFYECFR